MNTREILLKGINDEFVKWQISISNLSSINLLDQNVLFEKPICDILNIIFDYALKNTGSLISNYPGIDLIDNENKIGVQVTSNATKKKIQDTLDTCTISNLEIDELLIIILGDKQKAYNNLLLNTPFNFDPKENIIDFKGLIKRISFLPIKKMEAILKSLQKETYNIKPQVKKTETSEIKHTLRIKEKLKKILLDKSPATYFHQPLYTPNVNFIYGSIIVRNHLDRTYPDTLDSDSDEFHWCKLEFWDFYDNGIEFLTFGEATLVDEDGNWDFIYNLKNKNLENIELFHGGSDEFLRVPFSNIIEIDKETDGYRGNQTLYVKCPNKINPYEDILYGMRGYFDEKDSSKNRMVSYLDNNKRGKLNIP